MTYVSLTMIALVTAPLWAFSQLIPEKETQTRDEPSIIQLLDEQSAALKSKDLEALGRMWAADYIFVNPTGVVVTKDQRLKVLGSSDTRIDSLSRDEINIRLYENAAVVISRTTAKGRVAGKDIDAQFRATTVLVKKNGGWQIVSHQDNVIPAH